MGKSKRGQKGHQNEEFEDQDIMEPLAQPGPREMSKQSRKDKKGKKKGDDLEDTFDSLSLEDWTQNGQDKAGKKNKSKAVKFAESDEEFEPESRVVGKKVAARGVSAFSMLNMDDQSNSDSDSQSEDEVDHAIPFKPPVTEAKTKPAAKQKKGKAAKKQEDDDDIEKILAEIDSKPATKSQTKKKKKGKKDESEDVESLESGKVDDDENGEGLTSAGDYEAALAAMEAEYDDEDDKKEKKKKKKNKEDDVQVVKKGKEDFEVTKKGKEAEEEEEEKVKEDEKETPGDVKKAAVDDDDDDDGEDDDGTVKSAAQKRKDKKEKQRLKKLEEKVRKQKKGKTEDKPVTENAPDESALPSPAEAPPEQDDKKESDKKKKKKKKATEKEEKPAKEGTETKKKSKMVQAILEQQKKIQDEEAALKRAEEEKRRQEEEEERRREEKARLAKEKKEREKLKKKEKIARQKAEGVYLSATDKEKRRRAQQMLIELKAQGVDVPLVGEKQDGAQKKRVVYDRKKKRPTQPATEEDSPTTEVPPCVITPSEEDLPEAVESSEKEEPDVAESVEEEAEDVKDEWDASDEEEEEEEEAETTAAPAAVATETVEDEESEEEDSEEESEEEESEEESEESSEEESEDDMTVEERNRHRALTRIQKRHEEAENKRSVDLLRAPVVCVLGHVDTGKTKILDKLRRTSVQDGEAGGITQQIGATNVPRDTLREQTKMVKEFSKQELQLPGLLIIDTPGHESFSNLRTRGSSLCDIAILVVDIMHGLEPQTIESIDLLKKRKTPFIVALNKVDRLYQWQSNPHTDIVNTLKKQKPNTKLEFEERLQQVVVQFAEQGLNVALFHENKNQRQYISMVPTSAHSGDGMGNMIALICDLTQNMLAKHLSYSEELQATVMEVKAIQGLGTTIDVILVNGMVREGERIVVAGQEGPIVTTVRGLLMPQPLRELRVKSAYEHHKEVKAAHGCKIIAKDLDKALAGLPLYTAQDDAEAEIFKEELAQSLKEILSSIKLQEHGVFVQASTLGSLEALLEFLKTSKIPYAGINIGPVHKRDIMKASVMLEHDSQYAVILAFDVKVERDAQEMADSVGVKIFTAEIIYHLFDSFMAFRDELKRKKQLEFKNVAVFPCKLRILPQYVFNSRDPIVMGVVVEAGFIKDGTPLCVPSKEGLFLGRVTSLELNHKPIEKGTKGQEVCIKIDNIPGETPKMFGRHFDETDIIMSKISRASIDAVKNYFREEMTKTDWQLMVELKKVFEII